MSRIGILGASGNLGGQLLTQALAGGWEVHALTRDPGRIRKANEHLTVFQGDAERGEGLAPFVAGCRHVIYAVDSTHPADCVGHLVRAIGSRRLERVVLISRVGVGDSEAQVRKVSGWFASLAPRVQSALFKQMSAAEELLRLSGLPYSIFRATELTDDPPGKEVVATRATQAPPSRLGRADLARFIIHSLEEPAWTLQEVTVGARRH
jgi:uncharacterized protein YbjT (DUF2867 family)